MPYIRLSEEDIRKLARKESIVVFRTSPKQGMVSVYDEDGRDVGSAFLRRLGIFKPGKNAVETERGLIPLSKFRLSSSALEKLNGKRDLRNYFVCTLEPVKIRVRA